VPGGAKLLWTLRISARSLLRIGRYTLAVEESLTA